MPRTFRALFLVVASLAIMPIAHGQMAHDGGADPVELTVGDLVLTVPFTRATLPNAEVGGGYLDIENTGSSDDTLLAARSPMAREVQIHAMEIVDDVMRMRQIADGIAIPAGETVSLAPGGLHLMMMDIAAPFVEGETVPVTLVFARAGEIEIDLAVMAFGATNTDHGGHP